MSQEQRASVAFDDEIVSIEPGARKVYVKPEIICELILETRAGSPLGLPDPLDPFKLDSMDD